MNIITDLTRKEWERQKNTLNLIASENYPSPKTLQLLGSVWMNKYSEGYPGKRYYAGNENTDLLEDFVKQKALEIFAPQGGYGVNVQVLSGSPANSMVFLAMLQPHDTILSLNLAEGGHLSHLHDTSSWNKFFRHFTYSVKRVEGEGFEIDYGDFELQLKLRQPKLTIIGFSSYPKTIDFKRLIEIAHRYNSLVLADIAHINGLVATGLHDSPFQVGEIGADFVSMTTHKTLRGPRSAMLFAKDEYIGVINKTVFPGTSGGPHMNKIAALGQSLLEITGEDEYPDKKSFYEYMLSVLSTCKELETGLLEGGLEVVTPTQNHLCLVRLPLEMDSLEVQKSLENMGVILNRNVIPNETKTPWRPSGLRLGTAALASRGLTNGDAHSLGLKIGLYITGQIEESDLRGFINDLTSQLNWHY